MASSRPAAKRLKIAGGAILLLGGIVAALVYWRGTQTAALQDDPALQGFHRAERRQMNALFGKMGGLVEDWSADLQHPGTQAALILIASTLIAAGCFYFARRSMNNHRQQLAPGKDETRQSGDS
jgi:hypothetical protein